MRVCVQEVIGRQVTGIPGSTFNERFCSNDTDPGGKTVEDAWAQSITVMKSEQDDHLISVLMRASYPDIGNLMRMVAIQDRDDADYGPTGTETEQRVTTDAADVPFGWDQDWGLHAPSAQVARSRGVRCRSDRRRRLRWLCRDSRRGWWRGRRLRANRGE